MKLGFAAENFCVCLESVCLSGKSDVSEFVWKTSGLRHSLLIRYGIHARMFQFLTNSVSNTRVDAVTERKGLRMRCVRGRSSGVRKQARRIFLPLRTPTSSSSSS